MKMSYLLVLAVACTGCATTSDSASPGDGAARVPDSGSLNQYLYSVILEREGKFEESLQALEAAVNEDPDALSLQLRLMWGYYRLGDYEKSLEVCEDVAARVPEDPALWTLRSRILERLGRKEEAADALRRAAALRPGNDEALIDAELQSNDIVAAVDVLEGLVAAQPEDQTLRLRLALMYLDINDLTSARASLETLVAQAPDNERARYLLGLVCIELEDFPQAERLMAPFAEKAEDYPAAPGFLASALARQGKRSEALGVLKAYHASKRSEPGDDIVLMYLAMEAGEYTTALDAVPPIGAPVFGTIMRALVRHAANEPTRPILETLDEVEGDPDGETPAYFGDLRLAIGADEMRTTFLPAIDAIRDGGTVSRVLETVYARMLLALGEDADAARVCEAALGQFGSDFLLHSYAGLAYDKLKDVDAAERHLRECLALKPDDHNTMNSLGYLLAEANVRLNEAEKLINAALDLDPDNPFYLDSLGWVYYRQGKAAKAVDFIRRAIYGMDSDDAILRSHLGDAYFAAGDKEKAAIEWEKALRLDPTLEEVKTKLEKIRR